MTQESLEIVVGETVASYLLRGGVISVTDVLRVAAKVAEEVGRLHASGRLHLSISVESVSADRFPEVTLAAPDAAYRFGGVSAADETCPPVLRRDEELEVPGTIEGARAILNRAGILLEPTQIDIYQLGVLLCRLTTGESVNSYLRSPQTKGKVPKALQTLLDRCLGFDKEQQYSGVSELLAELKRELANEESPIATPLPTDAAKADTSPSFVQGGKDQDTSVVGPTSSSDRAGDEVPFKTLGHFSVVEKIGHGGMGDVYRGYEAALDRTVAIKVLPSEFARQDDFVRRFYAEATAAAKLVHPNILQMYFIGEDAGHHYFAMQYVEGESLADLLSRRGRLGVEETLAISGQILSGLAAAHRQGMVHRDIKPGNILLDAKNRRALLADFGLVKSLQHGEGLTATGMVMGTVDYISPEQGRGQPVDARSDLYSYGVLLYQILSGRLPFQAESPTAMIFQHVYEGTRPLHEITPDVPELLSRIVSKLMAKSAVDRYQSADELLADLSAFRAGKPLPSGTDVVSPHPEYSSPEPAVRDATASVVPSNLALTRLIEAPQFQEAPELPVDLDRAAPTGWWMHIRNRLQDVVREQAPGVVQHLQNTQQQVGGAVSEYERRHRNLQKLVAEAELALEDLTVQLAIWQQASEKAEARAQQAENEETSRESSAEHDRCRKMIEELQGHIDQQQDQLESMQLRQAQVSATLEKLRSQRDILNARLKVAQARLQFAGGRSAKPRWRRWLLSNRIRLAQAALVVVVASVTFTITYRSFTVDEESVAPTNQDVNSNNHTNNSTTKMPTQLPGIPLRQFAGHEKRVSSVAFSPNGNLLASASADGTIRFWDPITGASLRILKNLHQGFTRAVGPIAFSKSGRLLASGNAFSAGDSLGNLKIWDVERGAIKQIMSGKTGPFWQLAFTPDEKTLLTLQSSTLDSKQLIRWDVETGNEVERIDFPEGFGGFIKLSPDGSYLAARDSSAQIKIWEPASSKNWRFLKRDETVTTGSEINRIHSLVFSADSETLASTDANGHVLFWDPKTGQQRGQMRGLSRTEELLGLSDGGKTVITSLPSSDRGSSNQSLIRMWSSVDERVVKVFHGHQPGTIAFSPSHRWMATGGDLPFLLLWDISRGLRKIGGKVRHIGKAGPFVISSDGSSVLFGTRSGVGLCSIDEELTSREFASANAMMSTVDLSPDGRTAVAGSEGGVLALWNVADGKILRQINLSLEIGDKPKQAGAESKQRVINVSYLPHGRQIFVATNKEMFLWDVQTGTQSHHFSNLTFGLFRAAVSPDGRFVATGGGMSNEKMGDLRLWDMASGAQIRRFIGHHHYVWSVAFSPDSSQLLTGGMGTLHLWNVASGKEIRRIDFPSSNKSQKRAGGWPKTLAFSPDGLRAACIYGGVCVWDLRTGEELFRLPIISGPGSPGQSVAFTADGHHVLATDQMFIKVWDTREPSSAE